MNIIEGLKKLGWWKTDIITPTAIRYYETAVGLKKASLWVSGNHISPHYESEGRNILESYAATVHDLNELQEFIENIENQINGSYARKLFKGVYDLRYPGQVLWFEYHCTESKESAHFHLWKRTHRRVEVLGLDPDSDVPEPKTTFNQRCHEGIQCLYRVRFSDGYEDTVFEDELLDATDQFCRPAYSEV